MEDVAAQVAAPLVFHQRMGGPICSPPTVVRKRSLPFHSSNNTHQNVSTEWDPNSWGWDNSRFVARPLNCDRVRVGSSEQTQAEPSGRNEEQTSYPRHKKSDHIRENGEDLRLVLGDGAGKTSGGAVLMKETHPIARPNKRVRSGSPSAANYPICQVDDCKEDLSTAKDYHRRHKVCEVHSKASKALVGVQMQRFCQQCSRFHPLLEFDEGKRSCRRRLAGHNRRRRKTQAEDTTQRAFVPGSRDNNSGSEIDIINLLSVLAQAQGNYEDRNGKFSLTPCKSELIQILSKINSLPLPDDLAAKLSLLKDANGSIPTLISSESQSNARGVSQSTVDLLALFSAAHEAPNQNATESQSHASTEGSDSDKSKSLYADQAAHLNLQRGYGMESPHVQGDKSIGNCHSPVEVYSNSQDTSPNLALQLFSSSPEDGSARKLTCDRIYLSSDSSNPSGEGSPICSPPLVHNLFPMQTSKQATKVDCLPNAEGEYVNVSTATDSRCSTSLRLFGGSIQVADAGSHQSSPNPVGYGSSTSNNSPTTVNSDAKDRTGRITFKLFERDPSHLPGSMRTKILNWLSNSPSEMESYIRPGCVVLSVYILMPSFVWDRLEENLHYYINHLVKNIDADFWGKGRFLVHMDRQMAFHKDGNVRLQKSWRAWSTPELISVSPVAVVPGQETSLILRGRGLKAAGTQIRCTHTDVYSIREAPISSNSEAVYDEVSLCGFRVNGLASTVLGRCFIEVENNFRGSYFPVIIADKTICQELRLLEREIDGTAEHDDDLIADRNEDIRSSREEVMHFLDELGWLFQRKHNSSLHELPHYRITRFKFLLTFSVDHYFCGLVKTLLDILVELNQAREGLVTDSLAMLSEIHLLNRAVKRRCRKMVELLVHYSVTDPTDATEKFIFAPNMAGTGGITPLHLAACTSSSEDLIDALTSDAREVGLQSWNSVLDNNRLSPYAYALMRDNHSYNAIVARKLADRRNNQVSVSIENVIEQAQAKTDKDQDTISYFNLQQQRSCSKCAAAARRGYSTLSPGSQGLLQRPYIHSMLVVAAVCVCVCLMMRGHPFVRCVSPFVWENLDYGPK